VVGLPDRVCSFPFLLFFHFPFPPPQLAEPDNSKVRFLRSLQSFFFSLSLFLLTFFLIKPLLLLLFLTDVFWSPIVLSMSSIPMVQSVNAPNAFKTFFFLPEFFDTPFLVFFRSRIGFAPAPPARNLLSFFGSFSFFTFFPFLFCFRFLILGFRGGFISYLFMVI